MCNTKDTVIKLVFFMIMEVYFSYTWGAISTKLIFAKTCTSNILTTNPNKWRKS